MDEETQKRIEKIQQEVADNLRSEASGQMEIEQLMKKFEPKPVKSVPEKIKPKQEVLQGETLEAVCIVCEEPADYRAIDKESGWERYLCSDCAKGNTKPLPLVNEQPECADCEGTPACKIMNEGKEEYLCADCTEARKANLESESEELEEEEPEESEKPEPYRRRRNSGNSTLFYGAVLINAFIIYKSFFITPPQQIDWTIIVTFALVAFVTKGD